jgi:hypothetical protein
VNQPNETRIEICYYQITSGGAIFLTVWLTNLEHGIVFHKISAARRLGMQGTLVYKKAHTSITSLENMRNSDFLGPF